MPAPVSDFFDVWARFVFAHYLDHAKITDVRVSFAIEKNIGRLDIAMHVTFPMDKVESNRDIWQPPLNRSF